MILITEFMDQAAVDDMAARFPVTYKPELADAQGDIPALMAGIEALIVRNRTQVNAAILNAADRLKVVGRLGVGLDNIDLDACKARVKWVFDSPDGTTVSASLKPAPRHFERPAMYHPKSGICCEIGGGASDDTKRQASSSIKGKP